MVSCDNYESKTQDEKNIDGQHFVDNYIRKSNVIIDDHEYNLFEYGCRNRTNYQFQLEHKIDCKKCLDTFD